MKKFLLLVCALPCLLSAQNATVKGELNEKQAIKSLPVERLNQVRTYVGAKQNLPAEKRNPLRLLSGAAKSLSAAKQNRTVTYAGEANMLPDSVYMYADEENTELLCKIYYTCYEDGRPKEIRTVYFGYHYDWEQDELVMVPYEEQSKEAYRYLVTDGLLTMEITSYYLSDGKWEIDPEGGMMEFIFKESDFNTFYTSQVSFDLMYELYVVGINAHHFNDETNTWEIPYSVVAIEFDGAGRPTIFESIDKYYDYDEETGEPIEGKYLLIASYNAQGLRESFSMYQPTGNSADPWELYEEDEYFYNAALQFVKKVIYDVYYDEYTTYEYEYNVRGLLIKESENDDYGFDIYEYKYDEQGNITGLFNVWEFGYYNDYDGEYYSYNGEYEEFYVNYYPEGVANETILSVQSAVYPNPASDVLNIRIAGADEALITLVSMTGSVVYQYKTTQPLVTIPVQSLTKGYYILTVQAAGQTKSYKVIIR